MAVGEGNGVAVGDGIAVLSSTGDGVATGGRGVGVATGEIGEGVAIGKGDEGLEITMGNFVVFSAVLVSTGTGDGLASAPAIAVGVLVAPADTWGKKL